MSDTQSIYKSQSLALNNHPKFQLINIPKRSKIISLSLKKRTNRASTASNFPVVLTLVRVTTRRSLVVGSRSCIDQVPIVRDTNSSAVRPKRTNISGQACTRRARDSRCVSGIAAETKRGRKRVGSILRTGLQPTILSLSCKRLHDGAINLRETDDIITRQLSFGLVIPCSRPLCRWAHCHAEPPLCFRRRC